MIERYRRWCFSIVAYTICALWRGIAWLTLFDRVRTTTEFTYWWIRTMYVVHVLFMCPYLQHELHCKVSTYSMRRLWASVLYASNASSILLDSGWSDRSLAFVFTAFAASTLQTELTTNFRAVANMVLSHSLKFGSSKRHWLWHCRPHALQINLSVRTFSWPTQTVQIGLLIFDWCAASLSSSDQMISKLCVTGFYDSYCINPSITK